MLYWILGLYGDNMGMTGSDKNELPLFICCIEGFLFSPYFLENAIYYVPWNTLACSQFLLAQPLKIYIIHGFSDPLVVLELGF